MDQGKSAADHWQFSLAVYGQQGIAEHCLELQHRLGMDVNVLLLMLWAAGRWDRAPTSEQIADADGRICAWRQQIVTPLRQLRTRLKHGPPPAPDITTDGLREDIKQLELNAERMEQDVLAQWVKVQEASAPSADPAQSSCRMAVLEQTAVRVIAHYEGQCVQPDTGAGGPTADPWLALQHAHQIVLAASVVLS